MIKGKYIATIEIDISADEDSVLFENLKFKVENKITHILNAFMQGYMESQGTVAIHEHCADIYISEEE